MANDPIASQHAVTPAEQPSARPPLPRWMYKVANPLVALLLRSPLHRLISNDLMLITFRGRTSGKTYTIPVGYLQRGNRLFLFSHSGWSKNLQNSTPVVVRLRGRTVHGTAAHINDPARMADVVGMLVARRGEAMARRMGFRTDQQEPESAPAPPGTVFVEITLTEQP